MAEKTTIARPYARALFELAEADKTVQQWSESLAALSDMAGVPAVVALIDTPEVTAEKRADVLIEIAGDAVGEKGRNLLRLLSQEHRLGCLPEIASEYEAYRSVAEATVDVEVRSAVELDDQRRKAIAASLERRLNRDVRLHPVLDESVVGGAVLQAGDTVIDESIRGKLDTLAAAMTL